MVKLPLWHAFAYTNAAGNVSDGLYGYTEDLLALGAASHYEVSLPVDCCHITTPLEADADVWERLLSAHPDRRYVKFIVDGIQRGFRIGCNASRSDLRSSTRNVLATYSNSSVVDKYLKEELEHGRLVVVESMQAGDIHVSKLGVIPKKHQPGKWRLIVNLSSPKGASTNDFISPSLCSLSYASVDDAAAYVFQAGRGALLAKLDVKSAYRNIPVHPDDRYLLGIQWQGKTFVDTCLPFGLRSAPKLFNAVADALEWIIVNEGGGVQVEFVIHYLDDFLFGGRPGGRPGPEVCGRVLDLVLRLCQVVGFPVMQEKVLGPATVIDFLGFIIDTVSMEIRLPAEKLSRIKQMIHSWRSKKSCTKCVLSLIGNLQHSSSVVKPGRTFLRPTLYDRPIETSGPYGWSSAAKCRISGRLSVVGNISGYVERSIGNLSSL